MIDYGKLKCLGHHDKPAFFAVHVLDNGVYHFNTHRCDECMAELLLESLFKEGMNLQIIEIFQEGE